MEIVANYCPVVGICSHRASLKPDTYFLIQPFDEEKQIRENEIRKALDTLYGDRKGSYPNNKAYYLEKSDEEISNIGIYCEICQKIRSSQYCIVDITGKCYTTLDNVESRKKKIFIRPNVTLELGMSYALNKPVFILSKEIEGKREIPSDIKFVTYIDITPKIEDVTPTIELGNWEGAAQKIVDYLRKALPKVYIQTLTVGKKLSYEDIMKSLSYLVNLKEISKCVEDKTIEVDYIVYRNGKLIGVIPNGGFLKEGIPFKFYIADTDGIEDLVGDAEVYNIQPDGICQVEIFNLNDATKYPQEIINTCMLCSEKYNPSKSRLELLIPLNQLDREIRSLKDRKAIIDELTGEL
jgi:hypothetical protein